MTQVVAICLLKNEDQFVYSSIRNLIPSVDHIIILDNESTDDTMLEVDRALKAIQLYGYKTTFEKHSVPDPLDTNRFLTKYVNTDTWVIGVDGDEVYNPTHLSPICNDMRLGKYKDIYRIDARCMHVKNIRRNVYHIEYDAYEAPPSRGIVKMYNFLHVTEIPKGERLHGAYKTTNNKMGMINNVVLCAHMCFMQRSSKETETVRAAPEGHGGIPYKLKNYASGPLKGYMYQHDPFQLSQYISRRYNSTSQGRDGVFRLPGETTPVNS